MGLSPGPQLLKEMGYVVHVAGAGACYQEKLQGNPLDLLGRPEGRFIYDKDPDRLREVKKGHTRLADVYRVIDAVASLTPKQRMRQIAIIAVPNHLAAIKAFLESGVTNFIVEKPLVNNWAEVGELRTLMDSNPALRVYPLDFYVQKASPLHILTGTIKPDDPRWDWVIMNGRKVPNRLVGALSEYIGPVEGISVNIVEGGNFGLPDLAKRSWLEEDALRGGMLLDLGTHALAPLLVSEMFNREQVRVEMAERFRLGDDRRSFRRALAGEVEVYSHANMTIGKDGIGIPLEIAVGKTFQNGGIWATTIRGRDGRVSMGLRTGDSLVVDSKIHPPIRLSLVPGLDPYALAFYEADRYFNRDRRIETNMRAMLGAISIIEEIKAVSNNR